MSTGLLAVLLALTTGAVIVAVFLIMWRERTSARTALVAVVSTIVLVVWAAVTALLAAARFYERSDPHRPPAIGIQLLVALIALSIALASSPSLRSLLTNQKNLIRLNVWRLVGVIFLALMLTGQMPAIWALPSGLGDIAIGVTAFWVAGQLDSPNGSRRAIVFNWLGLLDLVVAIGLGIATSPGITNLIHTSPTSELATRFPFALVPGFLVPLAFAVHIVSLWQLYGRAWVRPTEVLRRAA